MELVGGLDEVFWEDHLDESFLELFSNEAWFLKQNLNTLIHVLEQEVLQAFALQNLVVNGSFQKLCQFLLKILNWNPKGVFPQSGHNEQLDVVQVVLQCRAALSVLFFRANTKLLNFLAFFIKFIFS